MTEPVSTALPKPGDGCACTPYVQDAGGGHFEHSLEYEPACPEHSEHLWDPRQGMWADRAAYDAAVAAKTLRDAAMDGVGWMSATTYLFLHSRADHIERMKGAGHD